MKLFQFNWILVFLFLFSFSISTFSSNNISKSFFIENKGQWPKHVLYLARINGLDTWITKQGVTYNFYSLKKTDDNLSKQFQRKYEKFNYEETEKQGHVVAISNYSANSKPKTEGKNKQKSYYNFFIGADSSKWATYVGLYEEAIIKNIYTGIDQRWYFDNGYLRYDYIVHPGADYKQVQLIIEGASAYSIKDRDFAFTTRFGEVKQTQLLVYQNINGTKIPVEAAWIQQENKFSFEIKKYNKTHPLIIDPLIWSTFLGGNGDDNATSIKIDSIGNSYITGYTNSIDFPTTIGVYDQVKKNSYDAYVTKLNASGSVLEYSTFIGGNGSDQSSSISIDNIGSVYIAGATDSNNFPTTSGSYSQLYNGDDDVFVTKLNSTGSALIYSTYIGGNDHDIVRAMAIDDNQQVYITGYTQSPGFPTTVGSYSQAASLPVDVFVTKINATGSALIFSTFLDAGNAQGITIDKSENVYITGIIFPGALYTPGAYGSPCAPTSPQSSSDFDDIFIAKLNPSGASLIYSAIICGSLQDYSSAIAIDSIGNTYITGFTVSPDFPTTSGVYDQSFNGSGSAFVTKLNSTGTALVFSTFIGGSNSNYGTDITIDKNQNIYIEGNTNSSDYPVTIGAYDETHNGGNDIFVSLLNSTGSVLLYSTFIGGSANDFSNSIALDNQQQVYIAGFSGSNNYPTTIGSYSQIFDGGIYDAVVTKLNLCNKASATQNSIQLTANQNGATYQWINCSNMQPIPGETGQTFTAIANGQYAVIVILNNCIDTSACYNITGISIDENSNSQQWFIFPNPSSQIVNIKTENPANNIYTLQVVDVLGKVIYSEKFITETNIDISTFSKGIYYVYISDEINNRAVRKLVVQ